MSAALPSFLQLLLGSLRYPGPNRGQSLARLTKVCTDATGRPTQGGGSVTQKSKDDCVAAAKAGKQLTKKEELKEVEMG